MKTKTVTQDNAMFFVATVGISMSLDYFAQATFNSSRKMSQFPTDNIGHPGYIRIDSSALRKKGEDFWSEFIVEIRNGLLQRISYEFNSTTECKGDLAEHLVIRKDGYVFSFHIKQYERDSAHDFAIIDPKNLDDIPTWQSGLSDHKLRKMMQPTSRNLLRWVFCFFTINKSD